MATETTAPAAVTFVSAKPRSGGKLALTFEAAGTKFTTTFSAKRTQRGGVVGFDCDTVSADSACGKAGQWKVWGSRQHSVEFAAECDHYVTVDIDAVRAEVYGA